MSFSNVTSQGTMKRLPMLVLALMSCWTLMTTCCHASTVAMSSTSVVHRGNAPSYSNSRRRVPFTTFHDWGDEHRRQHQQQQQQPDYNKVADCSVRWDLNLDYKILYRVLTCIHLVSHTNLCIDLFSTDLLQHSTGIFLAYRIRFVGWNTIGNDQMSNHRHQRVSASNLLQNIYL
jgi:hypothetical protein